MSKSEHRIRFWLPLAYLVYSLLIVVLFYLLLISRSSELHTVWEVIHPFFMPTLFLATALLFTIVFSSGKIGHKLFFVVIHSILIHVFVIIIFPAGYGGVSQIILGRTRRVFDNMVLHGPWGWVTENIFSQLYLWTRGTNLQTSFSVILARMFGVDVYWSHLMLVPILWGAFVPIIAFKVAKKVGGNRGFAVISSLLVGLFPTSIFWGAVSTPNSLGFLFAFCSVYFALNYMGSGGFKSFLLMAGFSSISFLSHFLTGTITLSFVLLALAFRRYLKARGPLSLLKRTELLLSFLLSISILPIALVSQSLVYPITTGFSFEMLKTTPLEDVIWLIFLGEYVNFDVKTALIQAIGPSIGLIGIIYTLVVGQENRRVSRLYKWFLLACFLVISIDYRVLRLLMVGVPFGEERLWVMRDFILVPFVAILIVSLFSFFSSVTLSGASRKFRLRFLSGDFSNVDLSLRLVSVALVISVSLSGVVVASIYYSYPRAAALQITSYEIEAVRYIEAATSEKYIVIGDQWITYTGQMFVGLRNPRAYYFYHTDPIGVRLYNEMKENPMPEPMIEAMNINNSTVAYFVIETSELGYRLKTAEFDSVVSQASLSLKTYGIFGDGRLYIFYYKKE